MEKTNGYYAGRYLKNNGIALLCELIVVLLLSLICSILIGAQPMWLAPAMATVAYLIAELRFMMAYVAVNARYDHDLAMLKDETGADENENETEQESAGQTGEAVAVAAAEQAVKEAPTVSADDVSAPCDQPCDEQVEALAENETPADEDSDMAEPVVEEPFEEIAPVALDDQDEKETPAEPIAFVQEVAEEQDPDEQEQEPEMVLESIEIDEDDLDDMTMDDGGFARDILEIGEVTNTDLDTDEEDALF